MKELRTIFHDVVNDLNAICVVAGTAAEMAKLDNYEKITDANELKKHLQEAVQALEKSEEAAVLAAEKISALKKIVYKLLEIDTSKPL